MGRATTLSFGVAAGAVGPERVLCDQAVFTSVRSGMAEGYRVIAASPGVQAVEKVELTRRSPSHGGLCEEDPEAVGLEGYKLPSGRYCVAFCCHAGNEHTARGGLRVYTHAVFLDRQAWRGFQANAAAVHAALAQHVESAGPMLKPAARLEKLSLTLPRPVVNLPVVADAPASPNDMVDSALAAAADLLAGRSLILMERYSPFRLLEKIVLSLPLEVRDGLDVSAGVRFSPNRKMRLVIVAESEAELQRRSAGLDLDLRQAGKAAATREAPFEAWERLLRRWWREGRRQDIQRLNVELCRGIASDALDRVARICEDTDALDDLSPESVQSMAASYRVARPTTQAEQTLVKELLQKASDRLAALQAASDS